MDRDMAVVKKLRHTGCSHSPLQKQSCTAEAEAKLQNPEICMPPNYPAKNGFATSFANNQRKSKAGRGYMSYLGRKRTSIH